MIDSLSNAVNFKCDFDGQRKVSITDTDGDGLLYQFNEKNKLSDFFLANSYDEKLDKSY